MTQLTVEQLAKIINKSIRRTQVACKVGVFPRAYKTRTLIDETRNLIRMSWVVPYKLYTSDEELANDLLDDEEAILFSFADDEDKTFYIKKISKEGGK